MTQDFELKNTIINLIETRREDEWWDFKQYHHHSKVSLLHDIICMANNKANRDAYIILGIDDKTGEITGTENDPNRWNQQKIVQLLKECRFAGEIRPRVEVRSFSLNEHEIDVFIIKNSTDVPYYLSKDYQEKHNKDYCVRAYHIYTRVMDNNTDIDKNADIRDVEYLWKKRFGLIQTPLEHISILLSHPDEWEEEEDRYYHKLFPQYTFYLEDNDSDDRYKSMFYHHVHCNSSFSYGILKVFHYTTQMYSCQTTCVDSGRLTVPCPDREYFSGHNRFGFSDCIYYYATDSFKYRFLRFFENESRKIDKIEAQYEMDCHLSVVLLFEDKDEVLLFKEYVEIHRDQFSEIMTKQKDPVVTAENDKASEIIAYEIKMSKALKEMQLLFYQDR